jgi:hypothetical protein
VGGWTRTFCIEGCGVMSVEDACCQAIVTLFNVHWLNLVLRDGVVRLSLHHGTASQSGPCHMCQASNSSYSLSHTSEQLNDAPARLLQARQGDLVYNNISTTSIGAQREKNETKNRITNPTRPCSSIHLRKT